MSKLYTSYYGKLKDLSKSDILPIAISKSVPKWFNGMSDEALFPSWEMIGLGRKDDYEGYERLYLESISKSTAKQLYDRIMSYGNGRDVAILCYESMKKEGEWCHRHMVADYIAKGLGIEVQEYGLGRQLRGKHTNNIWEQVSLF